MFWSRLPSSLKNHATCSAARIAINDRQAERLRALGLCSQCRRSICRVRSGSQPQNKIITPLGSSEFPGYDLEAVNSQGSNCEGDVFMCTSVPGSFKIIKYQWYHKMDGVPFDRPWHMSLSGQVIWNCARAYNHKDNVAIAQDSPQAHGLGDVGWPGAGWCIRKSFGGVLCSPKMLVMVVLEMNGMLPFVSWICRTSKNMNELQETDLMGIFCQCASSPT